MTAERAPRIDPRAEAPGICGITRNTGSIEWVCVRKVHDTAKQRSSRPSGLGYYPQSERHHFVRKYPMRSTS